jgi:hypothetical protein
MAPGNRVEQALFFFILELPVVWCVQHKAGAFPVPKVCQNTMFFGLLGLALSEKQIPQITENTEKSK